MELTETDKLVYKESQMYSPLGKKISRILCLVLLLLVGYIWSTDVIIDNNLLYNIDWKHPLTFLETKNLYFFLHIFTFLPVFLLSFDKRVFFYKKWKYLFPAILLVAVPFIAWDLFFTEQGVWGFNKRYITGIHLFSLPIEECLFFLTVPFACVFIYECLNYYFPKDIFAKLDTPITLGLGVLFLVVGFLFLDHIYSSTTFLLSGGFLLFHFFAFTNTYRTRFYKAYLVSLFPFFIINGVLTGGYTQEPVVLYNTEEYLGLRITSVPVDDAIYGFLLLFLIISIYQYLKK